MALLFFHGLQGNDAPPAAAGKWNSAEMVLAAAVVAILASRFGTSLIGCEVGLLVANEVLPARRDI